MIVPMKKVSMIIVSREREQILKEIQKAGLIEIISERETASRDLEEKIENYYKIQRVIRELSTLRKRRKNDRLEQKELDPLVVLKEFERLHEDLTEQTHDLEKLEIEEKKLTPWGNFHMEDIHRLKEYGVYSHFYSTSLKNYNSIDFTDLAHEVIKKDRKLVYFIVFSKERLNLPANEASLPEESLEKVAEKIFIRINEITEIHRSLFELTAYIDALVKYGKEIKNSISYDEAEGSCGLDETGKISFITGWLAKKTEKRVEEVLNGANIWFKIEEPAHDEKPPVKLKNNWLVRPFEAITNIFSLPSYFEFDPTPLFAPFFMLFFGLCMADVGYGALVTLGLLVMYFKVPKDLKPVMKLGIMLGLFTVVAGYWLNTFFGASIFKNPGIENSIIPAEKSSDFLATFIEDGKMVFPAISFSLILGFTQVFFGILMNMANQVKEKGFIYGLQPVAYLVMMASVVIMAAHNEIMGVNSLEVGSLKIGEIILMVPKEAAKYMLSGGLFILLFFNNVEKKIWVRPPMALWELYNFISGLVGDILSYLRLFALGLAGGLLGGAFNNIAFMVMKNPEGVYSIGGVIGGVLIMVLGHSLNMVLAIMGAFVHSLRLTFVEFYKNLQFEGGGKPFTPFRLEK